jgi:hypothetical protein
MPVNAIAGKMENLVKATRAAMTTDAARPTFSAVLSHSAFSRTEGGRTEICGILEMGHKHDIVDLLKK